MTEIVPARWDRRTAETLADLRRGTGRTVSAMVAQAKLRSPRRTTSGPGFVQVPRTYEHDCVRSELTLEEIGLLTLATPSRSAMSGWELTRRELAMLAIVNSWWCSCHRKASSPVNFCPRIS
ncbi:hypothetical protein [Rhodococcus sp. NPDC058521]|uniref:hypothetical protein n=1 Tax=Rhodococcus sp. NPDC058521 TaxID=3346536 RepID=UPI00365F3C8E